MVRTLLARSLLPAALGTAASAGALAVVALAEGKAPLQPLNATSHWRHGRGAASVTGADWAHTGTGLATHAAATLFWAVLFEGWLQWRGRPAAPGLAADAAALAAVAAAVDYGATPRRFTPGWEFVLSKTAMAAAYAAMAAGLAVGAIATNRLSPPETGPK